MKTPTRKFAEQIGELVHSHLQDIANTLGVEQSAENARKIDLFVRAGKAIIREDDGIEIDHGLSEAEIAEIESFEDPLRFVAMTASMHASGLDDLKDGYIENAVEQFMASIVIGGVALGRMNIIPIEEISKRARVAAQKSHEKTYQEREKVRQYWLENIDKALNNSKAADILYKEFSLEHRTLAGYVSQFKKDILKKV